MQKKVLAVAIAGALGAPAFAFAQAAAGTSTVQIYGTMYGEFLRYRSDPIATSTAAAPDRINFDYFRTAGSEIGIKGEEQLGGGLAAWFQCSSTADFRGTTVNGWCSRNSALGMKGFFGNVYAGIWDTPYKRAYALGNVGSGETGGFGNSPILHNGATNPGQTGGAVTATSAQAGRGVWTRREINSVFYDSPVFAGFQFTGMYQIANASTNITTGSTNGKPRTWSLAGTYNAGPLGAAIFYEKHQDQGVTVGPVGAVPAVPTAVAMNNDMDDRSYGLSAAYTFGPVKLGGVWKREKYDVPNTAGANPGNGEQKVTAWHLGVDWNIAGPHGLRAGYTRSGDVKGSCMSTAAGAGCGGGGFVAPTGTGYRPGLGFRPDAQQGTRASMWQVKYVFAFSKRTEIQAGYSRINNSSNAGYGYSDIAGNVQPGKDPSAWVFTVTHKF